MAKKIVDCLEHYFAGLGYNCAETTLRAANEAWEMGMDENAFRLMGGFGGGMGIRNVCGAVSGGVAALSYYYVRGTGHQSPALVSAGKAMSAIDIRRNGSMHKSDFLNRMAFGSYNDKFENPRTASDWLSRDEAAVDLYNEDPLCGFIPTAGLLHDMMSGIAFVTQPKNIARMKKDLPILFVSGDCDPVGEQGRGVIRAYKCFLKAGMKDVTMKLYHGGRHEMLNETNRAEVYEDVLSWLNSKTGK